MSLPSSTERPRPNRRSHPGFTILEVLVVVAIVSILLAVLLPSLVRARRQVNQLVCQTNLSTIAKAWHMYLDTYGDRFPKSGSGFSNAQLNFGGKQGQFQEFRGPKPLNSMLTQRMKMDQGTAMRIFQCPFDEGRGLIRPTFFDYQGSSYLMNHLLVGPPGPPGLASTTSDPPEIKPILNEVFRGVASLGRGDVGNESKLLLVADYGWYNAWEPSMERKDHIEWHGRMTHNSAFMDGHVGLIRLHKGMYQTEAYTLIPLKSAQGQLRKDNQRHVKEACCMP